MCASLDAPRQGGYVLQPVVEFNGLVADDWDFVAWNCCPAGAVVHAEPLDGLSPGDVVTGAVTRRGGAGGADVFVISSEFGGRWSNLTADMTAVARSEDWTADWAEAKFESYYVTDCAQLPAGDMAFGDVRLATDGATDYAAGVPWTIGFEATDAAFAAPNCSGYATATRGGLEVVIGFADAH